MKNERKPGIVNWAQDLFARPNFCILDTETTGLEGDSEIVEIALLDKNGKTLLNQLVKPTRRIPSDVIGIHGINNDEVKNAPSFKKVWPRIERILKRQKQIVVYNVDFDVRMIEQSCGKYEIESKLDRFTWECAMAAYAEFYGEWNDYFGGWKWQKLITATRWATNQLKCDHHGTHRALNDCRNTLLVLKALAQYEPPKELPKETSQTVTQEYQSAPKDGVKFDEDVPF